MKIAVCIKQVPGTTQVEIDPDTGTLRRDGVASKMNPFDLYALETALRIRERAGGEIVAVTMGPPQAQAVLREAYAMGVDGAVLLSDRAFGGADVLATARTLSQGLRAAGPFDLVVCGRQTTDGDTAQVGAEVAEFLGIPHVTNICDIGDLSDAGMTVDVDYPSRFETVRLPFPCLVTVEKGIFEPRLPSYRLQRATADRPIRVLTLADMPDTDPRHYGLRGSATQVKRIFPPERTTVHESWTGSGADLADRLFQHLEEAKFLQIPG